MNLIKIGGAVLKNTDGFERLVDIINHHTEKPLLIVVSAFSKATSELEKAAKFAEIGKEKEALSILTHVIDEHITFADSILKDSATLESLDMLFQSSKERLAGFLRGLTITGELTPRTLDAILSFGEFFALHTVYHFLQEKGFDIHCIDSTSVIISDDNYGNAKPLLKETTKLVKDKVLPYLISNKLVLTQGFVAKSQSGEITTMGIESSNLTAVLLAEILEIRTITFWTDVEGVRSSDPKLLENTKSISELSYSDAYKAAINGLKLIHPEMIKHAADKKISLIYKSAFLPYSDFTIISESSGSKFSHLIIAHEKLILCEASNPAIENKGDFERFWSNFESSFHSRGLEIIYYSVFPDSVKFVYPENRNFEKLVKKTFSEINTTHCSLITVIANEKDIADKIFQNIILTNNTDIFSFDITGKVLRIIVSPSSINTFLSQLQNMIE